MQKKIRRQRTEGRGQKAEDRRQRTEGRSQGTDTCGVGQGPAGAIVARRGCADVKNLKRVAVKGVCGPSRRQLRASLGTSNIQHPTSNIQGKSLDALAWVGGTVESREGRNAGGDDPSLAAPSTAGISWFSIQRANPRKAPPSPVKVLHLDVGCWMLDVGCS